MKVPFANRSCLLLLLAGCVLFGSSGCSYWKITESLPSLDPQVRREREIARQVKNDPFPSAGQAAKKAL